MNDDLNASLHHAVDSALDQAMTADQMHRAVAERIRAKRRRRPALVIGSTLGSLAIVGGTAFAAIQLTGDEERPPVPDVIGSPRPEEPASRTPTPTPSEDPSITPAPEPAPDTPATFPAADPNAQFPTCGSVVDPPSGSSDLVLTTLLDPRDPFPTTFTSHLWAPRSGLRGEVATQATAVAVKDGIVVGSSNQTQASTTTPLSMSAGSTSPATLPSTLPLTLCTDGSTPLPAGRYTVWGSVEYTVTERTPYRDDGTPGTPVATNETDRMFGRVGSLWMSSDGSVVASPGVAAGWPENLDESIAFSGAQATPETVVWLQTSEDEDDFSLFPELLPAQDQLADHGYLGGEIPFRCQSGAPAQLGLGDDPALVDLYGIGVVFTTRAEAEAFAALWEPLHGPVVGIVTESVTCHFD